MSETLKGWWRVTYQAHLENGDSRRTTVILQHPSVRLRTVHGQEVEVISGREVRADAEVTDRLQVIMTEPGEAKMVRLVQDLVTERLVTPERESEASKQMRRG